MRKFPVALSLFIATLIPCFAQAPAAENWRARVAEEVPLLGDRNWIVIVDSAYPLQVAPGIETIETGAGQVEVLQTVLHAINRSIHVRPEATMDAELALVPEDAAPGVTAYRNEIADLLHDYPLQTLPHEQSIARLSAQGAQFHILVLKTNMTIPYTSVFLHLYCKYWSDDDERRLRAKMTGASE